VFKYTIIVPTHNRHAYMARSVGYFANFSANIIYVDSSNNPYQGELCNNMQYIHCPDLSFPQKALLSIRKSPTDLIAFCADDDFLLQDALNKGIRALEDDDKLAASVGFYAGFYKCFDGNFFQLGKVGQWPNVSSASADNIENFLSDYRQILWALYRREAIETAYQIICEAEFSNDNFIELVIAALCAYSGIAFIDDFWGVREVSPDDHWGSRHTALTLLIGSEALDNDFSKYYQYLEPIIGRSNAVLAVNSYLNGQKCSYKTPRFRKFIPKFVFYVWRMYRFKQLRLTNNFPSVSKVLLQA